MAYIYTGEERIKLLNTMLYRMALVVGHGNSAASAERLALAGVDRGEFARWLKFVDLGPDQKRAVARIRYLDSVANTCLDTCLVFYKSGLNALATKRRNYRDEAVAAVARVCREAGLAGERALLPNVQGMVGAYGLSMAAYQRFYTKRYGLVVLGGELSQDKYYKGSIARYGKLLDWVVAHYDDRGAKSGGPRPARQSSSASAAADKASQPS